MLVPGSKGIAYLFLSNIPVFLGMTTGFAFPSSGFELRVSSLEVDGSCFLSLELPSRCPDSHDYNKEDHFIALPKRGMERFRMCRFLYDVVVAAAAGYCNSSGGSVRTGGGDMCTSAVEAFSCSLSLCFCSSSSCPARHPSAK